jgi:hypothetical protein
LSDILTAQVTTLAGSSQGLQQVTTLAGSSQGLQERMGFNTKMTHPYGTYLNPHDNYLNVSDCVNNKIRKVIMNGIVIFFLFHYFIKLIFIVI